jgi:hypothetical protein
MSRIAAILVIVLLGWFAYDRYAKRVDVGVPAVVASPAAAPSIEPSPYRCDGRTHCSQMKSCAEATFFLRNCPNTQMDGDNDGVPCEKQWCK